MAKVLFVCFANYDRSPTAQRLFDGWRGKWEARSAGFDPMEGHGTPLTQELIDWADLVLVMESIHETLLHMDFKCPSHKVGVLGVRDKFHRNDPELIQELRERVPPILDAFDRQSSETSGGGH